MNCYFHGLKNTNTQRDLISFFLPVLFHFVVCRPAEIKQNTYEKSDIIKKPLIKMKKAKASPSPHAPQSRQRREHERKGCVGVCEQPELLTK